MRIRSSHVGGLGSEESKISLKNCQIMLGLWLHIEIELKSCERERRNKMENEKHCGLWPRRRKKQMKRESGWSRKKDLDSLIFFLFFFFTQSSFKLGLCGFYNFIIRGLVLQWIFYFIFWGLKLWLNSLKGRVDSDNTFNQYK